MKDNITKTFGVYLIQNLQVDSHFYVGSTSKSFAKRWAQWRLDLKAGRGNPHLINAWNYYGEESFEFTILQELPEIPGETIEEKKARVLAAEQEWIDSLQPYYNWNPVAGSRLGSQQSEETKEKIKAGMSTIEAQAKMSEAQTARFAAMTDDEKEQMYASQRGMKKHSEEWKKQLSETANERLNNPESVAKRAATKTGVKRTEEQRARMREAQARRTPLSEERRAEIAAKISESLKAGGHRPPSTKGRVMSEEQQLKISVANTGKPKVCSS